MFLRSRARPVRKADNLSLLRADCLDNVGSLTSHNPLGLHGLLQRELCFTLCALGVQCYFLTVNIGRLTDSKDYKSKHLFQIGLI
jgi:hypothetical protein